MCSKAYSRRSHHKLMMGCQLSQHETCGSPEAMQVLKCPASHQWL